MYGYCESASKKVNVVHCRACEFCTHSRDILRLGGDAWGEELRDYNGNRSTSKTGESEGLGKQRIRRSKRNRTD